MTDESHAQAQVFNYVNALLLEGARRIELDETAIRSVLRWIRAGIDYGSLASQEYHHALAVSLGAAEDPNIATALSRISSYGSMFPSDVDLTQHNLEELVTVDQYEAFLRSHPELLQRN